MLGFGCVELLKTCDAQLFYSTCYALKGSGINHTTDIFKDEAGNMCYTISVKKKVYDKAKVIAERVGRA